MIASRIFAALAALFLVAAVAIAALTPFGMTLGQGLMLMDGNWLTWMQKQSPAWSWAWLIPAGVGLICAGTAASLNFGRASPSRRKRS